MDSIQLKIEFEGSLRRASVNRKETSLAKLKQTLAALVGLPDCSIKYRDEENDLITLGSDAELDEFLSSQVGATKVLRVIVTPPTSGSTPPPPATEPAVAPEPEEPEIPWINLARALAQPEVVGRVQQTLQSPVLTEAVNRAAQGYVDSKGDFVIAALMASQQLPLVMGVAAELLEELPVLKDLQTLMMRGFTEGGFPRPHGPHHPHRGHHGGHPHCGPTPGHHGGHPPHCGPTPGHHGGHPHCGPTPGHHGGHPHCGPTPGHHGGPPPHCGPRHHGGCATTTDNVPKHFGVFCDGCGSDAELKKASVLAGHQTRRGFIRGLRFKSQSVHDFDLCETCKNSDRFPDRAYGPFDKMEGQVQGQGRCRNPWWNNRGNNNNWRQAPPQAPQAKKEEPEFDFMNAIRSAVTRGTEAFVQATKNEQNDLGDIARAIAESLREEDKPKQAEEEDKPQQQEEWESVVKPEVKEEPKPAETTTDPFVKWATQLSQLEALGFDRTETYITFLEEEKGDLDRVVSRIVSRDL